MLVTRVAVVGKPMTTRFDGARVFETVSTLAEGTACAFFKMAGEMGSAHRGVVQSKAITLGGSAAVLWADKREWDPVIQGSVLAASFDSTLAVAVAVSLVGGFGAKTEFGGAGIARGQAGVLLAIGRVDSSGTYCLAYVFVVTAIDLAPPGARVGRWRVPMSAVVVVMVVVVFVFGSGHEQVDQVEGCHVVGIEWTGVDEA